MQQRSPGVLGTLPVDQILYNPAINARRDTETDITELVATIKSQGLGQPLLVRPSPQDGSMVEPVEGGRRLRAINQLIASGDLPADFEIPVYIRNLSDTEALELSLATAVTRVPLNPADEAQSFQKLVDDGRSEAEIAAHFGVPIRRVKQRLAIARLPEPIVEALRAGRIPLAIAQAFTITSDEKTIASVWKKYETEGCRWHTSAIIGFLTEKRIEADSPEALYVGREAYLAAGGRIDEDLFSNNAWFVDGKILAKCLEQKLKAEEKRYLADGWSFVEIERDLKKIDTKIQWPRLAPEGNPNLTKEQQSHAAELRGQIKQLRRSKTEADAEQADTLEQELDALTAKHFTPAQKKKAGVLILFDPRDREIVTIEGAQKPRAAKQEKAAKPPKSKPADDSTKPSAVRTGDDVEADFTGALEQEMATTMTHAMQGAIAAKPGLSKRLLAAAFIAEAAAWESPLRLQPSTRDMKVSEETAKAWAELRQAYAGKRMPQIFQELLVIDSDAVDRLIGQALSRLFAIDRGNMADQAPIITAFDPTIGWAPGPEFFKRLGRDGLAAALNEAAVAGVTPSKKKKELVEMALRELVPLGWLPKPLRTPSYKGPGSNAWAEARATMTADAIKAAAEPQHQQAAE